MGTPPPSPLASVMASGSTPNCSYPNKRAQPADARLHLVEDHDQVVPVAPLTHLRQVVRRRHDDAALALYRLDHDGARLVGGGLADGVDGVVRHVHEAGRQGLPLLLVVRLSRGGRHREGAAVEGV